MSDDTIAERLARIDEKLKNVEDQITEMNQNHKAAKDQLYKVIQDVAYAISSSKSAHHRIDDFKSSICWTLGFSVTVVGVFASILTLVLSR